MSLPIKINGEKKRIPTNWEELNLGQAIDLIQWSEDDSRNNDLIEMAAIISGIDRSKLLEQKPDVIDMLVSPMMNNISNSPVAPVNYKSKHYLISGNVYNSFINVGEVQYGCMDIFEKTLAMECKFIEKIPLLIAAFSYKGRFGGREVAARKDIEDLANDGVMKMPLYDAFGLASFFLDRYQIFLRGQEIALLNTPKPKVGLALKISKSLASLVRFIRFQMAILRR